TLTAREFTRLAGGLTRRCSLNDFADDCPGLGRVFLKPAAELLEHHAFDDRTYLRGNELILCLRGKLRVGNLHRQNARESFAAIIARKRDLLLLLHTGFVSVFRDNAGECRTETGQMRAAIPLRNVVGEAK